MMKKKSVTEEPVKLSVSSIDESVSSSIEVIPSVPSSEPQRDAKLPKATTLEKWKNDYEWLAITERNTMICKICVSRVVHVIPADSAIHLIPVSSTNFDDGHVD